jgi:hypothetical protein
MPIRRSLLLLFLAGALLGCPGGSAPSEPRLPAVFRLRDDVHGETFRILLRDQATVRQAEQLLTSGRVMWTSGRLLAGDGGFNAPWNWHLDPQTVTFAEVTIEACQSWPSGVEGDVEYWIRFGQVCLSARVIERER